MRLYRLQVIIEQRFELRGDTAALDALRQISRIDVIARRWPLSRIYI